jgi:hypothetical protein
MSGASGGVVYAGGSTPGIQLARYGQPLTLASGATVPPGAYFMTGGFSITPPGGTAVTVAGGYCISDGTSVVTTAAGTAIPIGAGTPGVWPWPAPFPTNLYG